MAQFNIKQIFGQPWTFKKIINLVVKMNWGLLYAVPSYPWSGSCRKWRGKGWKGGCALLTASGLPLLQSSRLEQCDCTDCLLAQVTYLAWWLVQQIEGYRNNFRSNEKSLTGLEIIWKALRTELISYPLLTALNFFFKEKHLMKVFEVIQIILMIQPFLNLSKSHIK